MCRVSGSHCNQWNMSAPTTECPVQAIGPFCNELADDRRKANWNDDGTLGKSYII